MNSNAEQILASLHQVAAEREARLLEPGLTDKVAALKAYQQRRFTRTYSDLLADTRYGPAARFFLDELYGPADFSQRDAQFERVVPALVRLFPQEIIGTVGALATLHALSESLDSAMGRALHNAVPTAADYLRAWQATGRPAERERQIALTLRIGDALERYTGKPLLRHSLRLMRGPAQAAGLSQLQGFLERGFDTFRAMRGADQFLALIGERERRLAAALFEDWPSEAGSDHPALGQLP